MMHSGMKDVNVHSFGSESSSSGWQRRTAQVRKAYKKKSVISATLFVVVLIVVISVSVSVSKDKKSSSTSPAQTTLTTNGPLFPPPELSSQEQQDNKNELGASLVKNFYEPLNIPWNVLNDENSPQNIALNWLSGRDEYAQYSPKKRLQRFALATFYYATFNVAHEFLTSPTDWSSSGNWILDKEECNWEGVRCNENRLVVSIILPKHAISGSIPVELAILDAMEELDFTSNYIHMEDEANDVWNHLANLKLLLFEDNFMVTDSGLPSQFSNLVSLEKLQLSYNLLQGSLEPQVFQGLQALRHLEIESNYISGDIPATVGQLPELVYLYARRNIMTIQFDQMILPGSYPSLFSLWLDNNEVSGTIPPAIGDVGGLASFSITNATLVGSIPTEFGKLQNLRRVWLYDNSLTGGLPTELNQLQQIEVFEVHDNNLQGRMPESICNSVAGSSYEFRQLTADCDRVQCASCCTVCYSG